MLACAQHPESADFGNRQTRNHMMPKHARAHVKRFLESMAEVRRIVETPVKSNLGDTFCSQARIAQIFAAALKTLGANPFRQGALLLGENPVYMPHRNAQRCRNFRWAKRRVGQMALDVVEDTRREFEPAVTRRTGKSISTDAGRKNIQIAKHRRPFFGETQAFRLFKERCRKPKQDCAEPGIACNAPCKRETPRAKLFFDHPLRYAQIQPRTVARTVRRPRRSGINQCGIAASQNRFIAVLTIATQTLQLCNHDASAMIRVGGGHRIFVESHSTGREESHFHICQFSAGDRAVKGKLARKLEVAVSADLLGIAQPGLLAVRRRDEVGREGWANSSGQNGRPQTPARSRAKTTGVDQHVCLLSLFGCEETLSAPYTFSVHRASRFSVRRSSVLGAYGTAALSRAELTCIPDCGRFLFENRQRRTNWSQKGHGRADA